MYTPLPFRPPNKVVKRYTLPFVDSAGHKADITYIDYIDKKNKLIVGYTMFVKWDK